MSIVGDFTKGAGKKVSTRAARDAEDPDWEPQADDKEAAAAEKSEKAAEKKREREDAKANKAADAAVRQAAKKKAKTAAGEPADAESGSSVGAKRKSAAANASAQAPAPAAGKKRGRARSPSPPPQEESEDDEDYDQDGTDVVRTSDGAAAAAAAATAAAEAARSAGAPGGSSSAAPASMVVVPSGGRKARKADAHRFHKDLPLMMYGHGDARTPLPQTVHLMEDLVVDYITEILRQATAAAEQRNRATRGTSSTRVKERDLLFVLRKDHKRLDRVLSLLEVYEEQKAARGKPPEDLVKDDD